MLNIIKCFFLIPYYCIYILLNFTFFLLSLFICKDMFLISILLISALSFCISFHIVTFIYFLLSWFLKKIFRHKYVSFVTLPVSWQVSIAINFPLVLILLFPISYGKCCPHFPSKPFFISYFLVNLTILRTQCYIFSTKAGFPPLSLIWYLDSYHSNLKGSW